MKILVTGAKGFIGKNLVLSLKEDGHTVFEYDIDSSKEELASFVKKADFIVHLAGVNRPLSEEEFIDGNVNFTKALIDEVKASGAKKSIIFASSTQAEKDNPYGRSKKMAEDALFELAKEGHDVYVYRLYNVFGKWCRPNYNSVIATFCHNIANGLPISVNEEAPAIDFVYIDDIVKEFKAVMEWGRPHEGILYVEPHFSRTVKEVAKLLYGYKESRVNHMVPRVYNPFEKRLYSTYLSYLPETDFAYLLDECKDDRGSFTEILKSIGNGQFSVNVSKPGIIKGNHYHHTKNEKFLVVHGTCEIKFRKVGTDKVITYTCDASEKKVVDIPPGYTHSIKNIGEDDSVTFMWANEQYDPEHPDTIYLPVEEEKENG